MKVCVMCLFLTGLVGLSSANGWTDCVNLTDAFPCKDRPNKNFPICDSCQLGYFAQCEDDGLKAVYPCPDKPNKNGEIVRFVLDFDKQSCEEESPGCPREN